MKQIMIILAFFPITGFAQLHISPAAYLYNNDQLLFVTNTISLASNSNLYLRAEAQLLQSNAGASSNTGLGSLSVFQEGTSDNFDYNYWCSPVGIASAAIGNSPFGITLLNRPTTNINSTPAIALPTSSWDGVANPLSISQRWIYKFLNSNAYSQWIPVVNTASILAGEGFTMKGTLGTDATAINGVANNSGGAQRYDFRGKPNSGNITIGLANNQMTLTGNPYPCAIDLTMFLTDALNTTGIAYFWEHDKTVNSHLIAQYVGGYGTFSPISRGGLGIYVPAIFYAYDGNGNQTGGAGAGTSYSRRFSPIGQGFMVEGNAAGISATMRDLYRVYQKENALLSVFERSQDFSTQNSNLSQIQSVSGFDYTTVSSQEVPQIRFKALLDNSKLRETVLAFDLTATDGVDHAMDAKNLDTTLPSDAYFLLDNNNYIISVLQFDVNKRLPFGVKATSGVNFKFTVGDIVNFDTTQQVYIFDKLTQSYHNIVDEIFEINLPAGIYNERFEITFTQNSLAANSTNPTSFLVHQNNANQILKIVNQNLADLREVSIYDIAGKQILRKTNLGHGNQQQIETSNFSEGVYIVRIKSDVNQQFSQKFIVKRQ